MSDKAKSSIRQNILGAARAFRVVDGRGGAGSDPPPPGSARREDDDPCPVTPLGDSAGVYYFLDPIGQLRQFTARELGSRQGLVSLFRGDETWLRAHFKKEKEVDDSAGGTVKRVVDFWVNAASSWLIGEASSRGLFGDRVQLRKPGVWRADDGQPVVHCGDVILIDSDWQRSGGRNGNQIWIAAEATPRPAAPCDRSVGVELQQNIQRYWSFRQPAAAIAILGMLASGYLCGALDWRINMFIAGGTGSGKSALRKVIRNVWPQHVYTNDTTKAGMEQKVSGSAVPTVIDETNDRNRSSGRDLIDIVLSASGDEGTKGTRGTVDGKGRDIEVITSVVMFSIDAPELQPQHLNRFLMLELLRPEIGADFSVEHATVAREIARAAPSLWDRAIASFECYIECLRLFREALRTLDGDPRELDGKSALLAGWFILTREGLPDEMDLREGVAAIGEMVVSAERAALDDAPRRCLRHLLGSLAILHRSTDRDPIGVLLDVAYGPFKDTGRDPDSVMDTLGNYGLRPVRACLKPEEHDPVRQCPCLHCKDPHGQKRIPRGGPEDGLWIANSGRELDHLFDGTDFNAGRWRQQLLRLPTARPSRRTIRVGGACIRAIWLSRADLHVDLAEDASAGEGDVV